MNILSEAKAEFAETVRLRRYFHEYPELSNEEEKTIAFLESYLKGLGLETVNVPDGGLLAILDSGKRGEPSSCAVIQTRFPLRKVRKPARTQSLYFQDPRCQSRLRARWPYGHDPYGGTHPCRP